MLNDFVFSELDLVGGVVFDAAEEFALAFVLGLWFASLGCGGVTKFQFERRCTGCVGIRR